MREADAGQRLAGCAGLMPISFDIETDASFQAFLSRLRESSKMRKRGGLAALIGCFVLIVTGTAHASVFDFAFFSLPGAAFQVSGGGTLNSGADNSDPYLIMGATGTINAFGGQANITGVGSFIAASNNLHYPLTGPTDRYVDPLPSGLSFLTDTAGQFLIYASDSSVSGYRFRTSLDDRIAQTVVFTVAAVPGPVAGAGLIPLFGLAGAWYARRRKRFAAA